MKSLKNISLRYKLLFLLVALTTLSLIVYARLALSIFSEDKIAYVFDSSLAHINAVAKQLRSEVEFGSSKIQFYMNGYDPKESYFHPYTQSVLPKDSYIEGLWTYQYDSESTSYIKKEGLISTGANAKIEAELFDYSPQLIKSALENEIALFANSEGQGKWYLALKYQLPSPERPVVVIGLLSRGYFLDFFSTPQLQDTFLISQQSQVLIRPSQLTYDSLSEPEWKEALDFLTKNDNSRFSVHTWSSSANPKDSSPWLLASAPLGLGNLSIISFVPKDAALATVKLLAVKSSLFLILLIGCISIISVLTAHQLTSALKRLFEATRKVAKGDFEVEIPVESEDEVGGLTRGFNQMTQEIKRLLEETAQKSRMEAELQTAKTVQSTLFPSMSFSSGPIHIEGYYEPASECGGDWWYYNKIGPKTFLWIGDATGHGVPAALVTSAARSAARILEELPDLPLNQAMSLLNKAINGTSRGKVNMTFFLGVFNEETQILQYCNASHDPPFLIPHIDRPLKKNDILPLMKASGARLGESPDSEYNIAEIQLKEGDKIVLYTDGVTELRNSEGELWGERRLIRSVLKSTNDHAGLKESLAQLDQSIADFRQEAALEDDLTYFMFQYLVNSQI